jgi:hypothetical protein
MWMHSLYSTKVAKEGIVMFATDDFILDHKAIRSDNDWL